MKVLPSELPGVLLFEPQIFEDGRGFFLETYHRQRYRDAGLAAEFVQDNHSCSRQGTLRGLHYQLPNPQGKLVWAIHGEIFDVAVDMRKDSPTLGKWMATRLSSANRRQLYVPPGFAHGFCVVSATAEVFYKCTDFYRPQHEHILSWNDPELAIDWPVKSPALSRRDSQGRSFRESPRFTAIGPA